MRVLCCACPGAVHCAVCCTERKATLSLLLILPLIVPTCVIPFFDMSPWFLLRSTHSLNVLLLLSCQEDTKMLQKKEKESPAPNKEKRRKNTEKKTHTSHSRPEVHDTLSNIDTRVHSRKKHYGRNGGDTAGTRPGHGLDTARTRPRGVRRSEPSGLTAECKRPYHQGSPSKTG